MKSVLDHIRDTLNRETAKLRIAEAAHNVAGEHEKCWGRIPWKCLDGSLLSTDEPRWFSDTCEPLSRLRRKVDAAQAALDAEIALLTHPCTSAAKEFS